MKNFLYIFSFISFIAGALFLSTGCNDQATIPAFVRIDSIIVDSTCYDSVGSISNKVNFAWVYFDDNLQGVYQMPAKFPVIGEGVKNIKVFAGVYEFGNGNTATRYIFYDMYQTTDTLVVQDTLVLRPHVRYSVGLQVPSIQDFDTHFASDLVKTSSQGNYIANYGGGVEGQCGYMHLGSGETDPCVVESGVAINVPKNLTGYFLEMDYKCNSPFYFDITTSLGNMSIVGFNTKEDWNKAYIDLTYAMDVTQGTDVKLIFSMPRDTTMADQEVMFDNIKLIFRP